MTEIWLHGQAVKTSPFHGGNTGSIPVGVIWRHSQVVRQRSATPSSPVQIWLAPLEEHGNLEKDFRVFSCATGWADDMMKQEPVREFMGICL